MHVISEEVFFENKIFGKFYKTRLNVIFRIISLFMVLYTFNFVFPLKFEVIIDAYAYFFLVKLQL